MLGRRSQQDLHDPDGARLIEVVHDAMGYRRVLGWWGKAIELSGMEMRCKLRAFTSRDQFHQDLLCFLQLDTVLRLQIYQYLGDIHPRLLRAAKTEFYNEYNGDKEGDREN